MQPHRVTLRDPSLPHQVVFLARGGSHPVEVSCNCRLTRRGPGKTPSYTPIAPGPDLDTARWEYNRPAAHWTRLDPATDAARW